MRGGWLAQELPARQRRQAGSTRALPANRGTGLGPRRGWDSVSQRGSGSPQGWRGTGLVPPLDHSPTPDRTANSFREMVLGAPNRQFAGLQPTISGTGTLKRKSSSTQNFPVLVRNPASEGLPGFTLPLPLILSPDPSGPSADASPGRSPGTGNPPAWPHSPPPPWRGSAARSPHLRCRRP